MLKSMIGVVTPRNLSAAFVVLVGFTVGAWSGANPMTPANWAAAAMAITGAALFAGMIFAGPRAARQDRPQPLGRR